GNTAHRLTNAQAQTAARVMALPNEYWPKMRTAGASTTAWKTKMTYTTKTAPMARRTENREAMLISVKKDPIELIPWTMGKGSKTASTTMARNAGQTT